MKPGHGKSKGNKFENLIARRLSLWLTGGEDSTQLISSRLSGGWKDARWRQAGDLAPNGPKGDLFRSRFIVECKHHKKDLLWGLFHPPGENIKGWWNDLCELATTLSIPKPNVGPHHRTSECANLIPMMVCRQNNRAIFVVLPPKLAHTLARGTMIIEYRGGSHPCGIILWETFAVATPRDLLNHVAKGS